MSHRSSAMPIGVLALLLVLAADVAPLSAQVLQLSPEMRARIQQGRTPPATIQPRVYTPATFQARLLSLHGGAALLALANQKLRPAAAVQAAHASEPVPANTFWHTGMGAIGAVTMISPAANWTAGAGPPDDGYIALVGHFPAAPPGGTVVMAMPEDVSLVLLMSGPGTGVVTFVVIFDFQPSNAYPDSVTISNAGSKAPLMTCRASDLYAAGIHASGNNLVTSCAAVVSGMPVNDELLLTAFGANGLVFVDAAVMRVK